MSDYIKTIYYDLHALKRLIQQLRSTNLSAVLPYSFTRDACVVLHEIHQVMKHQGILDETTKHMTRIGQIRDKVKTSQGKYNRKYFEYMLNMHREMFGSDIDNIGFYYEEDILASSTIYPSFIYADTGLLPDIERKKIYNFAVAIGSTVATYLDILDSHELDLPYEEKLLFDEIPYAYKDVWDKRLYKTNVQYNVLITRLLLIQSELTVCSWLEKNMGSQSQDFNFKHYILLRFISIKFFEIMRNTMDIQKRLSSLWKAHSLNNLDSLIATYKGEFAEETKKLRNMLHYNPCGENFYDYVYSQIQANPNYAKDYIDTIVMNFIPKMRRQISESLNIQS